MFLFAEPTYFMKNDKRTATFNLSLIALSILFFSGTVYYLSPGVMTWDTASVLSNLSDFKFKGSHAPAFQYLWYVLLPFSKSQIILFYINAALYWYAILCFSLSTSPKSKVLSISFFMLALFPNMIFMNHVVNFDVIANHLLLAFFGTMACYLTYNRKILLIISLVFSVLFMMTRYNSLAALVPMILFWVYESNKLVSPSKLFKKFALLFFTLTLIHLGVTRLFFYSPPNYFQNFTAPYDLVGISIENNHTGITKELPSNYQKKLTHIYNKNGWFLGQPQLENTFKSYDIVDEWKKAVFKMPASYLTVRLKTVRRMFNGQTFQMQQHPLFYWHDFTRGSITRQLREKFTEKEWATTELTRRRSEFHAITVGYGNLLTKYFTSFPSTLWIACLGIVELLVLLYLVVVKKCFSQHVRISLFMTATALFWYIPLVLLVQIPMARYVYPANSLILASFPFMVFALKR